MQSYKTKYSLNAVKITKLNLTLNETELFVDSLQKVCDNLGIKYKNLSNYVELNIKGSDTVTIPITKVFVDSVWRQTANYDSKWYWFHGYVDSTELKGRMGCYHEVVIADEIKTKGWWIFKRVVGVDVKAMVMNPNDTIVSLKSIEVSKKKRRRNQ